MAFELPRLSPTQPDWPTFQLWWQQVVDKVEAQEAAQDTLLAQIVAAQATADAAAADAATATTNAAAAQSTADTVKRTDKISGSSVVPANVLSATDAGASATVTVEAHTRVYGDGTQLSVSSHNFTGKAYSTKYAVYYNDTTTSDTTPTYQITTTLSNAVANFASGRHFVGVITTPAAAGAPTTGGSTGPGVDPVDRGDFSTL